MNGEGPVIHYLAGGSFRAMAIGGVRRLCRENTISEAILQESMQRLAEISDGKKEFEQAIKIGFNDQFLANLDVERFARQWSEAIEANDPVALIWDDKMQNAFRIGLEPNLIKSHPKPLSKDRW